MFAPKSLLLGDTALQSVADAAMNANMIMYKHWHLTVVATLYNSLLQRQKLPRKVISYYVVDKLY